MEIVFRAAVIFFFLFIMMRGLGKRELSELSPFELVVLVTMGDLVQQGVTQDDTSITGAILSAGTMGLLAFGLSYVSYKSPRASRLLEGIPVVVIRDGELLEKAVRIERLTVEEVMEELREHGISDLNDIALGILETDGGFSFIKQTH